MPKSAKSSWSQKEWYNKPTKLQFQSISNTEKIDALKRYESTEVDRRTWQHVPSETPWSTSNDKFVITGGPRCLRGHMLPSSTVDFGWFVAFWEHQIFRVEISLKL